MKWLCRVPASACNHALANKTSTRRTLPQCRPIVSPSKGGRRALIGCRVQVSERNGARSISRALGWLSKESVCIMPLRCFRI